MDKDRIAGAAHEIKGSVKEAIGKAVGDASRSLTARPSGPPAKSRMPLAASRIECGRLSRRSELCRFENEQPGYG
jgi:hypothetical protein